MGVIHDAYLFSPCKFRDVVLELAAPGQPHLRYTNVREVALRSFRENARVRALADAYGGWDEAALLQQFPSSTSDEPEDYNFWLMLILYGSLEEDQPAEHLGLLHRYERLPLFFAKTGLSGRTPGMMTFGHNFGALFQGLFPATPVSSAPSDLRTLIRTLSPPSTASGMGWLSSEDVSAYLAILNRIKAPANDPAEPAFRRLQRMLSYAAERSVGLCLIVSG